MRALSIILTIILIFGLSMGIIAKIDNQDKSYDPVTHLRYIKDGFQIIPFEVLGDIWDDEEFYPRNYREYGVKYFYPYQSWNDASGIVSINAFYLLQDYDEQGNPNDWGIFEPIKQIVNGMSLVTYKVMYTFQWGGILIIDLFQTVGALNPVNGMVEKGVA